MFYNSHSVDIQNVSNAAGPYWVSKGKTAQRVKNNPENARAYTHTHTHTHTHAPPHVCLSLCVVCACVGSNSHLLLCRFSGWNSGYQAPSQAPMELSWQPCNWFLKFCICEFHWEASESCRSKFPEKRTNGKQIWTFHKAHQNLSVHGYELENPK